MKEMGIQGDGGDAFGQRRYWIDGGLLQGKGLGRSSAETAFP
jgi:hypothetical protein